MSFIFPVGAASAFAGALLVLGLCFIEPVLFPGPSSLQRLFVIQKLLYLIGLGFLPFCILLGHQGVRWLEGRLPEKKRAAFFGGIYIGLLGILFFLPGRTFLISPDFTWPVVLIACVVFAHGMGLFPRWTVWSFPFLVLLSVFSILVIVWAYSFDLLQPPGRIIRYLPDFNVTFSSVQQRWMGQWPLVDYSAQYGYYSFFLSGLGFLPNKPEVYLGVGVVGVLISIATLFAVLQGVLKTFSLRLLVLGSCLYGLFFAHCAPYWANLPIRVFFPFLSLLTASKYFRNRKSGYFWITTLFCSVAPYWNFDTGAPLLFTWFLALAYDDLLRLPLKKSLEHSAKCALLLIGIQVALVGSFVLATLVFRQPSNFSLLEFLRFQQAYFGNGAANIRTYPFHLWNLVAFGYIAALTYCLRYLQTKETVSPGLPQFVLMVSFMGLGIFPYYIMRSHFFCLLAVSWPALILLGIFLDSLAADETKAMLLRITRGMGLALLCLLCFGSFARGIKFVESRDQEIGGLWSNFEKQKEFIASLSEKDRPILILSDKSIFFYSILGIPSPLGLPSASEIFMARDIKVVEDYVQRKNNLPLHIVVDLDWINFEDTLYHPVKGIFDRMPISKKSADGRLLYYSEP